MQGFLKPKLILTRISVVLLVSALAIYLCTGLSSTSHAAVSPSNSGYGDPVGSWLIKVTGTTAPQPSSFQALYTYMVGGGIVETDEADFTPQSPSSPAHGTWENIGNNRFASTMLNFFFTQGQPAGMVKIQEIDTLSTDGSQYAGTANFTVFNNNGLQTANGSFTTYATRILVNPLS